MRPFEPARLKSQIVRIIALTRELLGCYELGPIGFGLRRALKERGIPCIIVKSLEALRGVSTLVSATVVSELGDLRRFKNPKSPMCDFGLVPREHSSGSHTWRGSIAKAGKHLIHRPYSHSCATVRSDTPSARAVAVKSSLAKKRRLTTRAASGSSPCRRRTASSTARISSGS